MSVSTHYSSAPAITEAGYRKLSSELDHLRTSGRAKMAELLRDVREDGDLADNPALLNAFDQQAQIEHRIAALAQHLADAEITNVADGTAGIGCEVVVYDLDTAEELRFQLVGEFEADASANRLSIQSPIGSAIDGLRAGCIVSVDTPRGMRRLELLEVAPGAPERAQPG